MRILSDIGNRLRSFPGRRAKNDKQETRQERRIHAALQQQEMERERGRVEGQGY
jgi:hypothetical protein